MGIRRIHNPTKTLLLADFLTLYYGDERQLKYILHIVMISQPTKKAADIRLWFEILLNKSLSP